MNNRISVIFYNESKLFWSSIAMVATTGLSLCMMIGMFCFITFMLRPLWTTRPDMLAVFIEKQLSLILLFISFYSVFPQLQMSINREKSNGLFATIMATPLTFQELIFGKSFFYFCMGYLCGIVVTVFYMIFLSYLMGGIHCGILVCGTSFFYLYSGYPYC